MAACCSGSRTCASGCSRATAAGRRGCSTASTSTGSGSATRTRRDLDRAPSEYFRANCYLSIEADELPARYFVDWFGDDNIVFSTDYPHGDSKFPKAVRGFLDLPIGEDTKRKALWDNWCRLYDMPL